MPDVDMKEWDADQCRISFAGFSISKGVGASGYADGVFCTIEQDGPSFTYKKGTDGTISRSKTNERMTKIVIRTMNTNSDTNGFLSDMLETDEQNPNGAGVGTFVLEDLQGTTKFRANKAWVSAPAKQTFDRDPNEREWEIHAIRSSITVGGN